MCARNISPVETCGPRTHPPKRRACVPLPEPGEPNRMMTGAATSEPSASVRQSTTSAANSSCARSESFIVTHDQLCFDLVDSFHGNADDYQQRRTTKIEIHAQTIQQPAREMRIDKVPDEWQALKFDSRDHDLRNQ